jgi:photosystem II stability/assembly factor-like uncharacterized protein
MRIRIFPVATVYGRRSQPSPGGAELARSSPGYRNHDRTGPALATAKAKTNGPHPGACWLALLFALVFASPSSLAAADAFSERARLAPISLLLDVTRAGDRLVAVGDRGHVLLSDDEGRSWKQVIVPTRAMLTGVSFGDARHGCAVGHDGVILVTADAGLTWTRQRRSTEVDTIWLDVHLYDAAHGFAVGAYGKWVTTYDGGKTWVDVSDRGDESHLNHIDVGANEATYLAGEGGLLLFSRKRDVDWNRADIAYEGSLFGTLPLADNRVLTYGLRGHVFASDDAGQTWTEIELPVAVLIMAGVQLESGVVVLAGAGGNFFISRDGGRNFAHWKPAEYLGGVSALLETKDGALLAVGESGAARLQLPLK